MLFQITYMKLKHTKILCVCVCVCSVIALQLIQVLHTEYLLLISMFLSHSCPKVIIVSRMQSVSRPDDGPAPGDDHNAALNVSEHHDK